MDLITIERDGYAAPISILDDHEVAAYRSAYDQLEQMPKANGMTGRPTQQHLVHKPFLGLSDTPAGDRDDEGRDRRRRGAAGDRLFL